MCTFSVRCGLLAAVLFAGWPIGSWGQDLLPHHRQLLKAIEQLEAQGAFQAALRQAEAAYTVGCEDSNRELMA